MEEEILPGPKLLQLPGRHRRRRTGKPCPAALKGGRFIPAALVRLHDDSAFLRFPVGNSYAEPRELSA